jgi:MarR family transcriptional regulator, organic hydroperoxide resistance regulator
MLTRMPALDNVLQFMQLLWALVHAMEKASKRMKDEVGVTGPQRLVLRVVGLRPGLSAGEVAEILHVHPSTLTGVLSRLVAERLLRRTVDPTDRRRAVLELTAAGERINAVSRGTVEAAVAAALAHVPDRDRAATRRVLTRMTARLDGLS